VIHCHNGVQYFAEQDSQTLQWLYLVIQIRKESQSRAVALVLGFVLRITLEYESFVSKKKKKKKKESQTQALPFEMPCRRNNLHVIVSWVALPCR
jgi:hypothetical protein